ncbi:DUF7860 family protein [Salinigranum salinum]|uniref:DUF7860 family protein n=1 Tax=Salinigranum salinum TaxID=1364937 RepID=UPI0012605671|nr:hypothetical protein [Salinigranum salinum]
MPGRYGDIDYPRVTKLGMLAGATLFVVGLLGELVAPVVFGPLPAWEHTLFFDLEAFGVVLLLLVPFVFGIALPLTE